MTDREGSDDELEIEVRPAAEVAYRLVILAAVVRRAMLEFSAAGEVEGDSPDAERYDLEIALRDEPLRSRMSPDERRIVALRVGALSEDETLAASWNVEAAAALAAAVFPGFPLDEPWVQASPGPLLAAIPEPWDDLDPFVASLEPLSDDDAAFERERAELWAWRAAIDDELRTGRGAELRELRATVADVVAEAVAAGLLPAGDRDFLVRDRPFASAGPDTQALIGEIARQRLHALNWLCGFGDSWSSVPLDL